MEADFECGPDCPWRPLENLCSALALLGVELSPEPFMFMGTEIALTGAIVRLYKHVDTRNYLNLDEAGHAYRFTLEEEYVLTPLLPAVERAVSW